MRTHVGAPLAGARISIGAVPRQHSMRIKGAGQEEAWTPRVVVSDPDGR